MGWKLSILWWRVCDELSIFKFTKYTSFLCYLRINQENYIRSSALDLPPAPAWLYQKDIICASHASMSPNRTICIPSLAPCWSSISLLLPCKMGHEDENDVSDSIFLFGSCFSKSHHYVFTLANKYWTLKCIFKGHFKNAEKRRYPFRY